MAGCSVYRGGFSPGHAPRAMNSLPGNVKRSTTRMQEKHNKSTCYRAKYHSYVTAGSNTVLQVV